MNTSRCTLTIAIPTYNGAGTIKNTLSSVIPQLQAGVEILIVDNCSTDNLSELIMDYTSRFSNVRYIRNSENVGYDRNVDLAIRNASGDFVWLLGDDDVILPGGISRVCDIVTSNPKVGIVFVNCPHTITVSEGNSGLCRDADAFFLGTRFKNGFMSTNVFSKALWASVKTSEFYGTGWIHMGFLVKALPQALAYIETTPYVDYVREGLGPMRWGGKGRFLLTGIELTKIYKKMPSLGYGKSTVRNAYLSIKGGYWLYIPLAKAKGFRTTWPVLLDFFKLYKGFFAFWVLDLPLLLFPGFIFESLFKGYKVYSSKSTFKPGSSIDKKL